jgi:hypothetical protein
VTGPVQPLVVAAVPRVTLTLDEAAAALGVSRDFFDAHVRPDLLVIEAGGGPRGRPKVLVRVAELERWARDHQAVAR